MARPALSLTPKTTSFRSIDIAWLRRQGARKVGHSGWIRWSSNGQETGAIDYRVERYGLRLRYRRTPWGGSPEDIDELIPFLATPMHLGGFRQWFECLSCGRRCRILYGGVRFRCRLCRGARYKSQYQHAALNVCDKRWRIRERLGERGGLGYGLLGLDDGFPPKPPRMHWKTYRRLEALDDKLAARWCVGVGGWLERMDAQLRGTRRPA
jgi:hypothetical protein